MTEVTVSTTRNGATEVLFPIPDPNPRLQENLMKSTDSRWRSSRRHLLRGGLRAAKHRWRHKARAACSRSGPMSRPTRQDSNNLVARMKDESKIFDRLGMKSVLYSVATEAPQSENTFVYILSHENREKAKENWSRLRRRRRMEDAAIHGRVSGTDQDHVDLRHADGVFADEIRTARLRAHWLQGSRLRASAGSPPEP